MSFSTTNKMMSPAGRLVIVISSNNVEEKKKKIHESLQKDPCHISILAFIKIKGSLSVTDTSNNMRPISLDRN